MNNLLTRKNKTYKTTTCAEAIVQTLLEHGTDSVFGYPGAAVLSIYNELSKIKSIRHILVRHEQAAVHAAEGYARTSGKTGVVLVTSGPGFTNTITGIANAYADSTPLVVLAGDVNQKDKRKKIFQNVDIEALASSCSKKVFTPTNKDDIVSIIDEAYTLANTCPKGPVIIALPRNITESVYTRKFCIKKSEKNLKNDFSKDIEKLRNLIKKSEKPLILIGGGAINASKEINTFVKSISCPVVSTLMGIGIYPSSAKEYLGMIGLNGGYMANSVLNRADLIIALGAAFSDRSTCKNSNFAKKSKIVSINIEHISSDFELEIIADIKNFLKEFNSCSPSFKKLSKWLEQISLMETENVQKNKKSDVLHSSFVLETLSELTEKLEPIVVTDVGQHQMLTAQFFNFNKPNKFITSGGLGTMGFGLPAAIGAYIANSDNTVLNITGDGSFQMNLQELATCREHNIPVKIIIMNNGYLGMVRQLQEKTYKSTYQVEMTNPDFTKIAEAYDLFAIRVNTKDELIPAVEKALKHNGTAIVDVMIDSFENI